LAVALALLVIPHSADTADRTLAGRLLIAVPEMQDPNFAQTIVYLVRHDPHGALGVVVNAPMGEVPLDRLLESETPGGDQAAPDETGPSIVVHYGGPVGRLQGSILHSTDVMPEGSVRVDQEVAYSPDTQLLRTLIGEKAPRHLLFALGYAGWAPGQLESEIKRGGWYVIDWDESLVFGGDHAKKWQRAVALNAPEL
jgi:putative transcriptional regulator